MGKIVSFPRRADAQQNIEQAAEGEPCARLAGLFARPFAVLRLPFFLVLYWLRGPVLAVCNLISVPCLLAFLVGLLLISDLSPHRPIVWFLGGASFTAFLIGWLYDSLLMRLSPDRMIFEF